MMWYCTLLERASRQSRQAALWHTVEGVLSSPTNHGGRYNHDLPPSQRGREMTHLFQPPRADQMPDPPQGQGFYKHPNKALYLCSC